MQYSAAMLAMNRIVVVTIKATVRTFIANLLRPKDGLDKTQKQRYTEDHNQHRKQVAAWTYQSDIAEAGCGQCRDCEIQGIDVIMYGGILSELHDVNDGGDDEDKHQQIDNAENNIFVEADKLWLFAQVA